MSARKEIDWEARSEYWRRCCQRLQDQLDEIREAFPEDAPCLHPETDVSIADEIRDLYAEHAALRCEIHRLRMKYEYTPMSSRIDPDSHEI